MSIRVRIILALVMLFLSIGFRLEAQSQTEIQHIAGVTIPWQYNLAVGKPDSLLYFYKVNTNRDSIWVNTFSCNNQGSFSPLTLLHTYHYDHDITNIPTVLLVEYRYNNVYIHVKASADSALVIITIDDNGNAVDHNINTHVCYWTNVFPPTSEYYRLFGENNVFATMSNTIYRINLNDNDFTEFWVQNTPPNYAYRIYPLDDDFLLAISTDSSVNNPNLFIDNDYNIHHMFGVDHNYYGSPQQISELYYETTGNTTAWSNFYAYLHIEHDSLVVNVIDEDSGDFILESDENIVRLADDRYICITQLSADAVPFQKWYGTYQVTDGNRLHYLGFPSLSSMLFPRSITRLNENYIVALSGEINDTDIDFSLIDETHQRIVTNHYSIDDNSDGWKVQPAGHCFYMIKNNRVHTFRLEEVQGTDDNFSPAIRDLTCYPNPFGKETNIGYILLKSGQTSCRIYNLKGQLVKTISQGKQSKGYQTYIWNGEDDSGKQAASGIYYLKVETDGKSAVHKMLRVR